MTTSAPARHRTCGHVERRRSGLWVCCGPFLHAAGAHYMRKAHR